MTIDEFEKLLENHDWYFSMSDDHRYWAAGQASLARIEQAKEALMTQGYTAWELEKITQKYRPW